MKLIITSLLIILTIAAKAQTLLHPQDNAEDSTYTDYYDGNEWGYITKKGITVGMTCIKDKDEYGRYYRIEILVKNDRDEKITFDPENINSQIVNKRGELIELQVYTNEEYQKRIRTQQNLSLFALGLSQSYTTYSTTYSNYGTTYSTTYSSMPSAANAYVMEQLYKNDRKLRQEGYLKKNTVYPDEAIIGYMNIKRRKGNYMTVTVTIDRYPYRFSWRIQ